jgi:hypothetical protein
MKWKITKTTEETVIASILLKTYLVSIIIHLIFITTKYRHLNNEESLFIAVIVCVMPVVNVSFIIWGITFIVKERLDERFKR